MQVRLKKYSFPKFGDFKGTQAAPSVDAGDVGRVVTRDFPEEAHDEVLAILEQFGAEQEGDSARVLLAALKLANGDVDRLISQIAAAITDWRDVVAAAEYPGYVRVRSPTDLSIEERRKIISADWNQYHDWLGR